MACLTAATGRRLGASARLGVAIVASASSQPTVHRLLKKHSDECGTGDIWQAGHDAVIGCVVCRQSDSLCVRAVHQSSSKLGDTPLARIDLFWSLPSRRVGCRASTTNSTAKSRSTSLYNARSSSRGGCRALQLYRYSAPERSTALQLYSALHSTSSTPSLSRHHDPAGSMNRARSISGAPGGRSG